MSSFSGNTLAALGGAFFSASQIRPSPCPFRVEDNLICAFRSTSNKGAKQQHYNGGYRDEQYRYKSYGIKIIERYIVNDKN